MQSIYLLSTPTIVSTLNASVTFHSFFKNTTTAILTSDKEGGRWSKVHFKLAKHKSVWKYEQTVSHLQVRNYLIFKRDGIVQYNIELYVFYMAVCLILYV